MKLSPDYLRLCKESLSNHWGGKIHVVFHQMRDQLTKEDYKEAVRIIMDALEDLEKRQFTIDHARSEKTVYRHILDALTLSPRIMAHYHCDDLVNELATWFDNLSGAYHEDHVGRKRYFSIPIYHTIIVTSKESETTNGIESSTSTVKYPHDEDETCLKRAWYRYHRARLSKQLGNTAPNNDTFHDIVFFCSAGNPDPVFPPSVYYPQFHQ